jgi:hypothetical protein
VEFYYILLLTTENSVFAPIANGNIKSLKEAIDGGLNPSFARGDGATLLHYAVNINDPQIISTSTF